MDKNGIICLTLSVIVLICTACLVLMSGKESDDDITITVMNSETIASVQTEIIQTTVKPHTTAKKTKTTVLSTVTEVSSISTNQSQEITETEPVYSDVEVLYIDINTADAEELMLLNGIGEVTAAAIISYRNENGGFRNIEEIMNVYGIGEAKFDRIREYIYVQNPVYEYEDEISEEYEEYQEPEPVTEEVGGEETETALTLENCLPVDINTADSEILMLLPYVNEQIAQDIITLRDKLNGFTNIYELLYIDKLNQKQVAELTEFVTVGQ